LSANGKGREWNHKAKLFSDILKETVGEFVAASEDCPVEVVALNTCKLLQAAAVMNACVACIIAIPAGINCGDVGHICTAFDACEEGACSVCGKKLDDFVECMASSCGGCDDSQGSSVSWI
jgi:hypothetical protein